MPGEERENEYTVPRKIRVTHIINSFEFGGAESMLCNLLLRTDRDRFVPSVISLIDDLTVAGPVIEARIPLMTLGMKPGVPDPARMARLCRTLREQHPDVIHTWMDHSNLIGGLAAWATTRAPVVWGIHHAEHVAGMTKRSTLWAVRACARLSGRLPAKIVCCSEQSRRHYGRLGFDLGKMIVIPNGFDTRRFRPCPQARREVRDELGIAPDALIVGLVARYDPLKDHATFLRAAAAIVARRPETFFLLCGQNIDSHNRALVEQIQSLGLTGHCRLLGPRRDMQRVYPALDVLASSSISEAFPLVVGEAMACGVPCAVTDVGDSALIVGETGKVVPRANPQALARAIEELLAMKADARGQLGQAARQRVCELFDLDSVTRRYEAIYEQLARERSARPGEYRRDDCATLERQARMPAPPWPSPQARVASPMPSADAGTLRPLKILMVVESSAGGTGRHVLELSEGLMARGCQVHLARSTRRVDQMFLGRLAKLPAIRQIALPMRTGIHPGDFAISRAIRRYARQFGPFDVVHGHSSKGGAFARLAALGTGAAAFYTLHGLIMMDPLLGRWKRLVYLMMERAMALRTARIIAVSPEEQRAAIGLGLGKSRVVLIPNGVAPAELSPRAKARQAIGLADDDALAIGFVGRLVSQKAVDVLLRAFARVVESAPHARLALVGAGPLEAELRTLAEQLSVGERVLWLGERDAREVLAAFEIFAIASRKEGLPYVVLEAMSAGLPIVATASAGVEILVEDRVNGRVTPADDSAALGAALAELAASPANLAAYGVASGQRAALFTIDAMVDRTLQEYLGASADADRSDNL